MSDPATMNDGSLFQAVLQIADDHLILGHRVSEWCGHAPMLEEDLSMPNMALDLIGQARNLYSYAAQLENKGRSEDDLAYLRSDREYRNCLLVEKPNDDFAHTMLRQLYYATFMKCFWNGVSAGSDEVLQGIAGKAVKELDYHIRHSAQWVIRLGDGTAESAQRLAAAVDLLHPYTAELFISNSDLEAAVRLNAMPQPESLETPWTSIIESVFSDAKIAMPEVAYPQQGGRDGRHTEDFGFLLAELQYMQRAYPGSSW